MDESRHTRFQFDRLEDWQKDEIVKKQRAQQMVREALAAQVEEKKALQKKQRQSLEAEENRMMLTPRERNSFPVLLSSRERRPVGDLLQGSERTESTKTDSPSSEPTGVASCSAKTGSGASFHWQDDNRAEKIRKQQELRQSLADQVEAKRVCGNQSPLQSSQGLCPSQDTRPDASGLLQPEEEEAFSKLFQWKQDEILKKRREQERTRKLLAEQIDEKKRRKSLEENDPIQSPGAERRHGRGRSRSRREEAFESPIKQPETFRPGKHLDDTHSDPQTDPGAAQGNEENCRENGGGVHAVSGHKADSANATHVMDELDVLKQQVEEQKRLLSEQAELMQTLQRQSLEGGGGGGLSAKRQQQDSEDEQPAPHTHKGRKSSQGGSERDTQEPRRRGQSSKEEGTPSRRNSKPRAKGRGGASRASGPSGQTSSLPRLRECTLRRNAAGKLGIEVEPLCDHLCVIKRVAKSFQQDQRKRLRPGDVVVALGAYNARKVTKRVDATLEQVLFADETPTFEQVTRLLSKAGALVTLAVCGVTSSDEVMEMFDQRERELEAAERAAQGAEQELRVDEEEHLGASGENARSPVAGNQQVPSAGAAPLQVVSCPSPEKPPQASVEQSKDDGDALSDLDRLDDAFPSGPDDELLSSGSKLLFANEWGNLSFPVDC